MNSQYEETSTNLLNFKAMVMPEVSRTMAYTTRKQSTDDETGRRLGDDFENTFACDVQKDDKNAI